MTTTFIRIEEVLDPTHRLQLRLERMITAAEARAEGFRLYGATGSFQAATDRKIAKALAEAALLRAELDTLA